MDERSRYPSDAAFWSVYHRPGQPKPSYSALVKTLTEAQAAVDAVDALAARTYFGDDLSRAPADVFIYKSKGRHHTMKKDKYVAEKWRELLAKDPAIAADWQAMRPRLANKTRVEDLVG